MYKIAETHAEKTLRLRIILLVILTSATNGAAIISQNKTDELLAYILAAITIYVGSTDLKISRYFNFEDSQAQQNPKTKEMFWLHNLSCKMSVMVSLLCSAILLVR
jgi:hypothetical protein